jgi:hypothetical protein
MQSAKIIATDVLVKARLFCTFQVSHLFIIFNLSYYSYLHPKALEYIK